MKKTLLTIITALLLLGVRGQEQKPMQRVADEHFMRYEYAEAAILYRDILKRKRKTDPVLAARLAECYRKGNRYADAAEWYAKAVAAPNAAPSSWLYYGDMLKCLGRYEEAASRYREYAQKTGSMDTVRDRLAGCDSARVWMQRPTSHLLKNAAAVNSSYADWGGVFYRDAAMLFTSDTLRKEDLDRASRRNRRKYGWTMQDHSKLYAADTMSNGGIRIRDLSPVMNRFKYHVGPLAFTRQYDTVLFTVTDPDRPERNKVKGWPVYGTRRLAIYRSVKKDGAWQRAEPFPYNKPEEYSVGHAAYSPGDDVMYFASDMPGGKGGTDIWYCVRQADGTLGPPQNCGDAINTPEDEQFPTIDEEGNLYFASKGHVGMGGFDIFFVRGERNQWGRPENLGYPRNSPGDDFYYITRPPNALLSSNRTGGKGDDDIYYIQLPQSYTPPAPVPILTIRLEGTVCPAFAGNCVYLYNKQRGIGWCFMPADGQFTAMLEGETDYVIRLYVNGRLRESVEFNTRGLKGPVTIQKAVCPASPTPANK